MQVRETEGTKKNISFKEKSVEADVELRQGLDKIVRKLSAVGNCRRSEIDRLALLVRTVYTVLQRFSYN